MTDVSLEVGSSNGLQPARYDTADRLTAQVPANPTHYFASTLIALDTAPLP